MSRIAGQALAWLLFAAAIGVFAQWPAHSPLPAGHGELRLSLAHLTERMEPCRTLTEAERQALPPNMRIREQCGRARAPAVLELRLGDQLLLADAIRPAGLHREGRAYLYRSWSLPQGDYELTLALRDTPREDGFDKQQRFQLRLQPGMSALLQVGDGEATLWPDSAATIDADHGAPLATRPTLSLPETDA